MEHTVSVTSPQDRIKLFWNGSNDTAYSVYTRPPGSSSCAMSYGMTSSSLAKEFEANYSCRNNKSAEPMYIDELESPKQPYEDCKEVRHTPISLNWSQGTDLLKLYQLKVPKGEDPYLELDQRLDVTYQTPKIVYLDKEPPKKNVYRCGYPNGCRKTSKRRTDLERHLINVHASKEQRARFECDYRGCDRLKDDRPFTRKDHCRNHYKDFHHEDVGKAVKKENMSEREWQKAQQVWRESRVITAQFWRCAKCLNRVRNSWTCCNQRCEKERIADRPEMTHRLVVTTTTAAAAAATVMNEQADIGNNAAGQAEHVEYDRYSAVSLLCDTCCFCSQSGWIWNSNRGRYESCPACQGLAAMAAQATEDLYAHSDNGSYDGFLNGPFTG
ncbi:hypothetical protein BJ878DRAFT_33263 [Calycina marina]|uniref:C2H2-type domain-containing protein n=1 Tax=Calycina marina TaxID=1763456 RepID=A0A9P8CFG9_9HELO|nr:hypothetical protein BJ878DRAFT_33263 [Calycina marina]